MTNEYTVAICEDCQKERYIIIKYLLEFQKQRNILFHYVEFSTGEEILETSEKYDILLLDLGLPGKDGISVAEKLHMKHLLDESHVIVISGMPERFKETYHIMVKDFVTKPIDGKEFFNALDYAIKSLGSGNYIRAQYHNVMCRIYEKDIIYVRAFGNYGIVTTFTGDAYIKGTVSSLESMLNQDSFFRCHRSYIVNKKYIKMIRGNRIVLETGGDLPIARDRRKQLLEWYSMEAFKSI